MEITKIIAANLDAWMRASESLNTLKKVSSRAGIGFGTVRRARNGDGNTTVQNLAAIAKAFRRRPEDLFQIASRPDQAYPLADNVVGLGVREPSPMPPLITELMAVAESINDRGLAELIGRAKEMAAQHPKARANRAN